MSDSAFFVTISGSVRLIASHENKANHALYHSVRRDRLAKRCGQAAQRGVHFHRRPATGRVWCGGQSGRQDAQHGSPVPRRIRFQTGVHPGLNDPCHLPAQPRDAHERQAAVPRPDAARLWHDPAAGVAKGRLPHLRHRQVAQRRVVVREQFRRGRGGVFRRGGPVAHRRAGEPDDRRVDGAVRFR